MKKTIGILIVLCIGQLMGNVFVKQLDTNGVTVNPGRLIDTNGTQVDPGRSIDRDGVRVDPGQLITARNRWVILDSTSSAGTEPSSLSGSNRTYQAVKTLIAEGINGNDEISIFDVPRSWNFAKFRCTGLTNDSSVVYKVYSGTLGDGNLDSASTIADCELSVLGILTFTIGTQGTITATFEFADTVTITQSDSDSTNDWQTTSPQNNRVAEGKIDLDGDDLLVIMATTAGSNCKLLGKGY